MELNHNALEKTMKVKLIIVLLLLLMWSFPYNNPSPAPTSYALETPRAHGLIKETHIFNVTNETNIKVMDAPDGSGGYLFYSTGPHVKKQKATVEKSKVRKLEPLTRGWHKDDNGTITNIIIPVSEKAGNYEFDIELSSTCVGCYTGTYSQTFTALTNTSPSPFSQSLTNISSLTANITDYATQSNPYAINESGLVGWWHFDNSSGILAIDNSTMGNTGTLTNMNAGLDNSTSGWNSSGKYNNALAFDGSNDYVNVLDVNSLDITNNITIGAWIYPKNVKSTGNKEIVSKLQSTAATYNYAFRINSNGYLSFTFKTGTDQSVTDNTQELQNNTWQHVSVVYNRVNVTFYLNGVNIYTIAKTTAMTPDSNNINIGSFGNGAGNFFNGRIDEVQIYNRSLSASEISALYYTHLQELKITATGNGTSSGNWNGTNLLSIPTSMSNTITGLTYTVPASVTINDIVVNDYRNSTKWNLTATAAFTENTTTITEDSASGYYHFNGSFLPAKNSTSGSINLTINDATFIASAYKGSASMASNNSNFSLTYNHPYLNISTGEINNSFNYTYQITIPYNNAPVTSIDASTSFTTIQNVTINTSASDPEGNALSCYVKVNGTENTSCSQNDFGTLPVGTYIIYFNVTEAATVSPQWVNVTAPLTVTSAFKTIVRGFLID